MAKKKNQILVEWLKSKDAGERNCVNVKHVVGDAESIIVGGIVSVKFNGWRYKASVTDFLGWTVSRKSHQDAEAHWQCHSNSCNPQGKKSRRWCGKEGPYAQSKNASLFLASGEPAREKSGDEEAT